MPDGRYLWCSKVPRWGLDPAVDPVPASPESREGCFVFALLSWLQVLLLSLLVSIAIVWLLGSFLVFLLLLLILMPISGWLKDGYGQFLALLAAPAFVDVVDDVVDDVVLGVAVRWLRLRTRLHCSWLCCHYFFPCSCIFLACSICRIGRQRMRSPELSPWSGWPLSIHLYWKLL